MIKFCLRGEVLAIKWLFEELLGNASRFFWVLRSVISGNVSFSDEIFD